MTMRLDELVDYATLAGKYFKRKKAQRGDR